MSEKLTKEKEKNNMSNIVVKVEKSGNRYNLIPVDHKPHLLPDFCKNHTNFLSHTAAKPKQYNWWILISK